MTSTEPASLAPSAAYRTVVLVGVGEDGDVGVDGDDDELLPPPQADAVRQRFLHHPDPAARERHCHRLGCVQSQVQVVKQ